MLKRHIYCAILLAVASACASPTVPASKVTIYVADDIILMTGEGETASAVAVEDGLIKGAGELDELQKSNFVNFPSRCISMIFMAFPIFGARRKTSHLDRCDRFESRIPQHFFSNIDI